MDLFARKNELASFVDSKQEKELFLKGFQNETEQLMFFEELTSFRRDLDYLSNKRTRREVADLFSQILDNYLEFLHADKSQREKIKIKTNESLDLLNKKIISILGTVE